MAIPEIPISSNQIIAVLLFPVVTTLIDWVMQSLFDRKVFQPVWEGGKRRFKAWRTKQNKITADYEFSIYLSSGSTVESPRKVATDLLNTVDRNSSGDFEILDQKWSDDGREVDADVVYKNRKESFGLTLNFVPDSAGPDGRPLDADYSPSTGSLGVTVTFRFAFGNLRSSIIDLMLFSRFLREAAQDLLQVRSVTDGRFVVSPINNNLTLDDWIKKDQFDVSLLLESEDGRSSVEFYSDRAVISSPHTDVDDMTVEYIRATLLNYYL